MPEGSVRSPALSPLPILPQILSCSSGSCLFIHTIWDLKLVCPVAPEPWLGSLSCRPPGRFGCLFWLRAAWLNHTKLLFLMAIFVLQKGEFHILHFHTSGGVNDLLLLPNSGNKWFLCQRAFVSQTMLVWCLFPLQWHVWHHHRRTVFSPAFLGSSCPLCDKCPSSGQLHCDELFLRVQWQEKREILFLLP